MSGTEPSESLLDQWRAEVGDEAIAAIVAEEQAKIAAGTLPALSDLGALREHLGRQRRRSA